MIDLRHPEQSSDLFRQRSVFVEIISQIGHFRDRYVTHWKDGTPDPATAMTAGRDRQFGRADENNC